MASSGEALEKDDERKRSQIPVRTSAALRNRLVESAAANDRSLTQEIEQRLERSLSADDARGSPQTARLLDAIAAEVANNKALLNAEWWESPLAYYAMAETIAAVVRDHAPPSLMSDDLRVAIEALTEAERERDQELASGNTAVLTMSGAKVAKAQAAFDAAMAPIVEARKQAAGIIRATRAMMRRLTDGIM
ncbi:hypothetical protein D9601_19295 [Sphingomonas sp. MA1305]|nr:hypothetical protein [Sphingomonas sp. MA1305]